MPLDYDGITFDPIVWFSEGEIVGNMIHCSIREQAKNLVYSWIVTVETSLEDTVGSSGIAPSLEIAKKEIIRSVCTILDGNFVRPTTDYPNWYTDMDGQVRCLHCNKLYEFNGDTWLKVCYCGQAL